MHFDGSIFFSLVIGPALSDICRLTQRSFTFLFQLTVHRFLPFGIMAGLAVAAAVAVMTAPETHNQPTLENLCLDQNDYDQNSKNSDNVDNEKSTLM